MNVRIILLLVTQFTKIYYRTIADQKCLAPETDYEKNKWKKMVKTQTVKNSNSIGESLGDQKQNTK